MRVKGSIQKLNPKAQMGGGSSCDFQRESFVTIRSRWHLREQRCRKNIQGHQSEFLKYSSSFLQHLASPGYKYCICYFLWALSQVFLSLWNSCSLHSTFSIPQGLVPLMLLRTLIHCPLTWASMVLVSEIYMNMPLFCAHWRGPVFYCWSLCQGKKECCIFGFAENKLLPRKSCCACSLPLWHKFRSHFTLQILCFLTSSDSYFIF